MTRRRILWILALLFAVIVITRLNEIRQLGEVVAQGQGQWIALAAVVQVGYYLLVTAIYHTSFCVVRSSSQFWKLVPVVFASSFANVAAPFGGTGGAALFIDNAVRHGRSGARTAAGLVLVIITDFICFSLVMFVGMFFLLERNKLQIYHVIGAVVLVTVVIGQSSLLSSSLLWPDKIRRFLGWLQRTVNRVATRLGRSALLDDHWAEHVAREFKAAATAITVEPQRLLYPVAAGLGMQTLNMLTMFLVFLAFRQPVDPKTLLAGYAMGTLFSLVSVTPQGVGVVEGVMALVYTSLGIPSRRALVIALTFRGLSFWIPFLIGFILLHRLRTFRVGQKTWRESTERERDQGETAPTGLDPMEVSSDSDQESR